MNYVLEVLPSLLDGAKMTLQQNFRWLPIGVLASSLLVLTACGGGGSSSSGTGTGTSNTAPVVGNVTTTAKKDASTAIKLQGTDADGDSLSYSVVKSPTNGKVTISGSTATYTPTSSYSGSDSFTYKANDGKADSGTATVSLTVTTVNSAPVATAVTATAITGIAQKITLTGTDADGDKLTAAISGKPQHENVNTSIGLARCDVLRLHICTLRGVPRHRVRASSRFDRVDNLVGNLHMDVSALATRHGRPRVAS